MKNYLSMKGGNFLKVFLIIVFLIFIGIIGYFTFRKTTPVPTSNITDNKPTEEQQPLVVTYPKRGEVFTTGSTVTIKWTGGNKNPLMIYLLIGSFDPSKFVIAQSVPNSGKYQWTIPDNLINPKIEQKIEAVVCLEEPNEVSELGELQTCRDNITGSISIVPRQ